MNARKIISCSWQMAENFLQFLMSYWIGYRGFRLEGRVTNGKGIHFKEWGVGHLIEDQSNVFLAC